MRRHFGGVVGAGGVKPGIGGSVVGNPLGSAVGNDVGNTHGCGCAAVVVAVG